MLLVDRFVSASFQDAFDWIAINPGLKSGAVVLNAFSIPFAVSRCTLPWADLFSPLRDREYA